MASSTIRKAIGVVIDQTSISIAKVAGNLAPELEVIVVKATSHEEVPADDKYLREILSLASHSRGYVNVCLITVSKRLGKTRDWIAAVLSFLPNMFCNFRNGIGQELLKTSIVKK